MTYSEIKKYLIKNKKNWLITGAAGFIGSNILEELLILEQNIICLDNFSTGSKDNLNKSIESASVKLNLNSNILKKNNLQIIEGDITSLNTCKLACKSIDFILHQAALGSVPRYIENPLATHDANVNGFLNMLIAARDSKVKRFIFASSSSVYGDNLDLPKNENVIGNQLSPYASSKYINELYAEIFFKNYALEYIGLRYFNVFGKNQDPNGDYAAVMPKWIHAMLNNKDVIIYGDGKNSRDFCYIKNVVEANILSALSGNSASNNIYNIGLNHNTSLIDLFDLIKNNINTLTNNNYNKPPIFKVSRPGDVIHSQANISKASNLLNFYPKYDIDKGIKATILDYIK